MQFSVIYITTKDRPEAQRIGRVLVEKRLAACVNVFEQAESIYWWGDEVIETSEAVLIAKTRTTLVEELIDEVKRQHSYNCPDIIALPIQQGNPAFLTWIASETRLPHHNLAQQESWLP